MTLSLVVLTTLLFCRPISADEIKLRRGGSYQGTVQKMPEENGGFYQILLENGGVLKIAKNEVDSVVKPQSSVAIYQAELGKHDLTKVSGHLEMAKWCQEQKLRVQKVKHLRKVVELDPDHEAARRLLGYTRHLVTAKWVMRDEYYHSIGYVGMGTSMRLPAAVTVEDEKKKHRDAINAWKGKVARLLTLLKNQRKFAEAKQELESIDDIKAIPVLIDAYHRIGKRGSLSDFDRNTKSLIIEILAKFDILSAKSFLVSLAIGERNDILQDEAEQILKTKYAKWTAEYLIGQLSRIKPDIKKIQITDAKAIAERDFISRAAVILEGLDTDKSDSILPLINLIHINRVLVPVAKQKRSGLGGASFGKDGSASMQQGSEKPKPRPVRIQMEPVRVALIKITEQRFDFDKSKWLFWYLSRTLPQNVDLRRLD